VSGNRLGSVSASKEFYVAYDEDSLISRATSWLTQYPSAV